VTFFVVFDTCTHAQYYGDVHQVLALPEGAVIRYEYKRYLYSDEAAEALEQLQAHPQRLPVPALLLYGEKQGFEHNDPEPDTMLTQADSFFIPTRSADLVAVSIERSAERASDVIYMHFQLKGFIDPDLAAFNALIAALEAAHSLPFGDKATAYNWISLLPRQLAAQRGALMSDGSANWTKVVDKFVSLPTQFSNDVFWRVRGVVEIVNGQPGEAVALTDRATNDRTHVERWRRDYRLHESKGYAVSVQTYSPDGHGHDVPGNASIAMTSNDDDQGLLKLSANPLVIVPNQIEHKRFSISTDAALDTRFTGIRLDTQIPDYTDPYPPGSLCFLTFSIRKQRWRVLAGCALVLGGAAIGGYIGGAKPDGTCAAILSAVALLLAGVGGWFLTQQFKLGK